MQNLIKHYKETLNSYPNYATFMIESCLFISQGLLGLVCFCNEQLQLTDWNYASKEIRFNDCHNTRYNFRLYKNIVFFQCSCHSKQTIWEMKLLIVPKEHTAVTLQIFNHAEYFFFYKQHFYKQHQAEISKRLSSILRLRHGHKYTKYKICLSLMKVICIKQHFPENFTKFLKTPFLQYTSGRLF